MRLVAVVTDVGGPVALHDIFSELPGDFGAPIVVMQPTNDIPLESAAAALRHTIKLKIAQMRHGGKLHAGAVYFAESAKSYRPIENSDEIRIEINRGEEGEYGLISTLAEFAAILGRALTVVFLSGRSSEEEIERLCSILESNGCPILVLSRSESVVDELGACVLNAAATASELSSMQIGEFLRARVVQSLPERKSKIRAAKR